MGCNATQENIFSNYLSGKDYRGFEKNYASGVKTNVGIAFGGGMSRAACLTLGHLKALHRLNVMGEVSYVSCGNGSAWTIIPYIYKQGMGDKEFLGSWIEPSNLSLDNFEFGQGGESPPPILESIVKSSTVKDYLSTYLTGSGENSWKYLMSSLFLEPFNCHGEKCFTYSLPALKRICNKNFFLSARDFIAPDLRRPFWVVESCLVNKDKEKIPFEFTPLLCGTFNTSTTPRLSGWTEPFAFNGILHDFQDKFAVMDRGEKDIFSLASVLSCTSAAPPGGFQSFSPVEKLIFKKDHEGKPSTFPMVKVLGKRKKDGAVLSNPVALIDPGWIDDLGLMSLVRRKVTSIIVFVNASEPLSKKVNPKSISKFFRSGSPVKIFKNNSKQLSQLVHGLITQLYDGHSACYKGEYDVVNNKFYGVKGGWKCNILWFYNEISNDFEDNLTNLAPLLQNPNFDRFPHFKDTYENPPHAISLDVQQAVLLSSLGSFCVMQHAHKVRDMVKNFYYAEF